MMKQLFERSGDLQIVASRSSSEKDFDFLIGKWRVHNRKLKSRLSNCSEWTEFEAQVDCRKILNGYGNIDSFQTTIDRKSFEGMSLRLFNPNSRLWSIYWADSEKVELDVPQVGSFENKVGSFYARDTYEQKEIIVQFRWDASSPNTPVWSQAFSPDNGQTWEWNWYMTFNLVN
jgi:lipopolysaccharide export LptBFGC system permease protein LptF